MNLIAEIISKLLSSELMMTITIFSWYKLNNKQINVKSINNIIAIIFLSIISIANFYIVNNFIRILYLI